MFAQKIAGVVEMQVDLLLGQYAVEGVDVLHEGLQLGEAGVGLRAEQQDVAKQAIEQKGVFSHSLLF